jgi:hypothetical protein
MAQWYAVCYKTGPLKDEVRSYGTVITDPLDTTKYYKVAIDHQPGAEEMWDKTTKTVVSNPLAVLAKEKKAAARLRKAELKAIRLQRPWTDDEFQEVMAAIL